MATSKKKSATGLLSEAGKKAVRGVKVAAKKAVGKKTKGKSAAGNLSEAAKKAGRGIKVAVKKAVGKKTKTGTKKSGSK